MKIQIFDKAKKKRFIELLSYFGIKKIPYLLIKVGKDRIRAYSGNFSKIELVKLKRVFYIENFGLYIGREIIRSDGRKEARLSLDGLCILKNEIKKNIFDVDIKQVDDWFRGKDIEVKDGQGDSLSGFVALRFGEDFIGSGRITADKKFISNFMPKERRIKD